MPKPRLACIYARVSSERQGRDNAVSIGEQIAACQKLIAESGDRLVATYVDDRRYRSSFSGRMVEPSAKRPDRPEWARMLAGAGREWTVLYAWRSDRICRGNETAGMFERVLDERRFDVVLATQTFDRDTFGLLAGGVGGFELRTMNVRMNMGREGRVRSGRHTGSPPFGYTIVRDDKGVSVNYAVTPEGRAYLDELAVLFLAGETYAEIGRRLGARFNGGRAWCHSIIRARLEMPFYRSAIVYGKRRPEGQVLYQSRAVHPAAWDAATIAAIDAELARRAAQARRGPRRRKHTYLFTGVLTCALCGRMMAHGGYTGPARQIERRYVCHTTRERGNPNHHRANSISEPAALAQFFALLDGLTEADVRAYIARRRSQPRAAAAVVSIQAELDQLEAEAAGYREGLARVRGISEAEAALAARLAETERRLADRRGDQAASAARQDAAALDDVEANMLYLLRHRDALRSLPYDELAREIQAHARGLRVLHGELLA